MGNRAKWSDLVFSYKIINWEILINGLGGKFFGIGVGQNLRKGLLMLFSGQGLKKCLGLLT